MWPHHYGHSDEPCTPEERCKFNLWSPVNANPQDIEDVAFSCYAKHQTELDRIVHRLAAGETSIELDDDFTESDMEYIARKLSQYPGAHGMLTLED